MGEHVWLRCGCGWVGGGGSVGADLCVDLGVAYWMCGRVWVRSNGGGEVRNI